ncbi:MAG: tetratricopeptide repeat protein [Pirellulaceae bacterium]
MSKRRPPTRDTTSAIKQPHARWSPRRIAIAISAAILIAGGGWVFADWWTCFPEDRVATYVGRHRCVACHAPEVEAWTGSHHHLAMDLATAATVLGDFNDAELTHYGITSRMFRQGDKYMIHTEGPDGEMQDFEIKYVFGVDPLQQYMVEFDRTDDTPEEEVRRVQVLRVSWDTHRKRWFYLPPPDVDEKLSPDDDLHWTGIAQRWNNMCADCHSTNLKKNFDTKTQTYHTTFFEIDVSCEACHGPASLHMELAEGGGLFWDRKLGYGLAPLKDKDSHVEIHACAPCHSRRRVVSPLGLPGENYYDNYANELLEAHTYYADGQILDEVYVYGSFIQSRMYHKDIRCTDCHDPHTARTRYQGNNICTTCHQHPAGKYDVVAHHRHKVGSTGALCVECHMPETTYMEVDPRRDHSLRVPRPDVSVRLGTPNACTRCHLEEGHLDPAKAKGLGEYADWLTAARSGDEEAAAALARADQWCAGKFEAWYGEKEDVNDHYAHVIAAARKGDADAESKLIKLAKDRRLPAMVRATGLMELGQYSSRAAAAASIERLSDADPQVRVAAIANLQGMPPETLVKWVAPRLSDPVRVVRTEAGRVLAQVPDRMLRGSHRRALKAALDEFRQGILASNDRAAAHMTLALLDESRGDIKAARERYETALAVEPQVSGPRTNLAALLDQWATESEQRLARSLRPGSREAKRVAEEVHHLRDEAARLRLEELDLLARDARLLPDSAALQYRYGLSLYLHERLEEAERALRKACELEPNTPDFLLALTLFHQKQGRFTDAIDLARRLVALRPEDATYRQLLGQLRQQADEAASAARR